MLEKNQPAPVFTTVDQHGNSVSLADFHGKQSVVLYFYPKDDTPGCTIEANEFTALAAEFDAAGAKILGVSADSCSDHIAFINKFELKIDLLADTSKEICDLYQTWGEQEWQGKKYMGINRATFIIDKQGMLAEVFYDVKAKGHAQAMLDIVKKLN